MKTSVILAIFTLTLAFVITSCQYDFVVEPELPTIDPDIEISFKDEIAPIFAAANCLNCHGGNISPNLTAAAAYNSIVPNLVDLNNPQESRIVTHASPNSNHAQKYNAAQAALLLAWIEQGAKNN
jgi:mono/diheme cytochrome c family protein